MASDEGLRRALRAELDGFDDLAHSATVQQLGPLVCRVTVRSSDGQSRSVVVKHLSFRAAERTRLVARRWLPAVELGNAGPPLLRAVGDATGCGVWHVYEDLGDVALNSEGPDPAHVEAVVEVVARLHQRFADHPLLAECRLQGEDLGIAMYTHSVRDAIRALAALRPPAVEDLADQALVRDRLLDHLHAMRAEEERRSQLMAELRGPETLLHGDLWPVNILVVAASDGLMVKLIDWDRAGIGSFAYDLSAFLLRFPTGDRPWVLNTYRATMGRLGWRLPSEGELNLLFDTAERARYANCIIWPALALLYDGATWGFEALAEIASWFDHLEPVLPL